MNGFPSICRSDRTVVAAPCGWPLAPLARYCLSAAILPAMFLISTAGCGTEPEVITAQTSKYEVADEPAGTGEGAAATDGDAAAQPVDTTPGGNASAGQVPAGQTPGAAGGTPIRAPRSVASDSTAPAGTGSSPPGAAGDNAEIPRKPSSTPPRDLKSAGGNKPPADSRDPQQLLAYLQELLKQQPRGTTREEALARFEGTQNEINQLADKILSLPATDDDKLRAAEGKIQALSILQQIGQPQAGQELKQFLAGLLQSKVATLARLGRRMTFAQQMDAFSSGDLADAGQMLQQFQAFFEEEPKDAALFVIGNQVARLFMQTGKNAEALTVMKTMHETFRQDANPQVAEQARSLGEEIQVVELDINGKLRAFLEGEPNSEPALAAALDQLLQSKDLGPTSLQIVLQIAQFLENRDMAAAAKAYDKIRAGFEKHADPALAKAALSSVDNFGKRQALLGQPFDIEGVTLSGVPFDWKKYQGKIVLIDFWATWCGPCLKEIPNIRKNYEQYKDRGFEVVGINLDDDPQSLQRFFSVQQLPWPTVLSSDPNKAGFENPLAVKCGIEAIPFLVLVGRDGKALALNLRGEQLGEKLAELFAEPPTPPASATPAAAEKKSKG